MTALAGGLFLTVVCGLGAAGHLPLSVPAVYLIASVVAFAAYYLDKAAAQTGGWRMRESTLHALGFLGGWPGALIAQTVLRHKSLKQSFRAIFWTTVVLNCGALAWLWSLTG